MRVRRLWPAALLLLAPVLTGCGDDEDPDGTDDATPTQATSSPTSAPTEATSTATEPSPSASAGLPAACDVLTSDDVEKAFGVEFDAGRGGTGTTGEQDIEWTSDNCAFVAKDLVEVTLRLTGVDDFTKGAFGCPRPSEIGAILEPVDDIAGADEGWWKVSDRPPLEATLRACAPSALVEIDLEYEDGVDYDGDPRNQSVALAELVLSALQG